MAELKTLKDLEFKSNVIIENKEKMLVWAEHLRAEAVKWIHHIETHNVMGGPLICDWIAGFFNITDEELK